VAILTARLFGLNLIWFFPLVVLMDTLQVPCFYCLYEHTFTSERLRRFGDYFRRKGDMAKGRRFFRMLRGLDRAGVVLLTMLPVKGGGMWSGVLLAHFIGLPKRTSFPLLVGGSILGSLLFVGVGDGLIRLWRLIA
ncbi:MAG: small multi-drug export protein, partial [Desulfobacterales bacterium]|nr:small multi-drug export protein [Desulfobacterales bacterium]